MITLCVSTWALTYRCCQVLRWLQVPISVIRCDSCYDITHYTVLDWEYIHNILNSRCYVCSYYIFYSLLTVELRGPFKAEENKVNILSCNFNKTLRRCFFSFVHQEKKPRYNTTIQLKLITSERGSNMEEKVSRGLKPGHCRHVVCVPDY